MRDGTGSGVPGEASEEPSPSPAAAAAGGMGEDDEQPIGSLFKIRGRRKSASARDGARKARNPSVESSKVGGMDDTLASVRKQLKRPGKAKAKAGARRVKSLAELTEVAAAGEKSCEVLENGLGTENDALSSVAVKAAKGRKSSTMGVERVVASDADKKQGSKRIYSLRARRTTVKTGADLKKPRQLRKRRQPSNDLQEVAAADDMSVDAEPRKIMDIEVKGSDVTEVENKTDPSSKELDQVDISNERARNTVKTGADPKKTRQLRNRWQPSNDLQEVAAPDVADDISVQADAKAGKIMDIEMKGLDVTEVVNKTDPSSKELDQVNISNENAQVSATVGSAVEAELCQGITAEGSQGSVAGKDETLQQAEELVPVEYGLKPCSVVLNESVAAEAPDENAKDVTAEVSSKIQEEDQCADGIPSDAAETSVQIAEPEPSPEPCNMIIPDGINTHCVVVDPEDDDNGPHTSMLVEGNEVGGRDDAICTLPSNLDVHVAEGEGQQNLRKRKHGDVSDGGDARSDSSMHDHKVLGSMLVGRVDEAKNDAHISEEGNSVRDTTEAEGGNSVRDTTEVEEGNSIRDTNEAEYATAGAVAEGHASLVAEVAVLSDPLPTIMSFDEFANREQNSGDVKLDCASEIGTRDCQVKNSPGDNTATVAEVGSTQMSADNRTQLGDLTEKECELSTRDQESRAGESRRFSRAWVDVDIECIDGIKSSAAIERWLTQSMVAYPDLFGQVAVGCEEYSDGVHAACLEKHHKKNCRSSASQVEESKPVLGGPSRGLDHLREVLVNYIASLLMPLYRARKLDREGYKAVMKKAITRVLEQCTEEEKSMTGVQYLDVRRKTKIRAFVDKLIERQMHLNRIAES